MSLADKCIVVGCFVCVDYDKILMETGSSLTTSRSLKMDSCLVLTECLGCRILRFRTSAIDLIHSERVSTSTSSFFANHLAYSSHASMIMPKFLFHGNETVSLYFVPLFKRSLSFILRTILKGKRNAYFEFLTLDLYWKHYFSLYQQLIPFNTNN